MADRVLEAVREGRVTTQKVSAVEVLRFRAASDGGFERLNRGCAVIASTADLDQYLWSYGRMVAAQWAGVLELRLLQKLPFERFEVTDVGCGQGLSTALFLDHVKAGLPAGSALSEVVGGVRLCDASLHALRRAREVVRLYGVPVSAQPVRLPDVPAAAAPAHPLPRVTILSNILDIEGFDLDGLRQALFAPGGRHLVVAVSNDRNVAGGGARVRAFKAMLSANHRVLACEEKAWKVQMATRSTQVYAFACEMES